MFKVYKKFIFVFILFSFIIGFAFGLLAPNTALEVSFIGDIFLNLIKFMIIPIVFCSIFLAVLKIKSASDFRRQFSRSILIFIVMFIVTMVISLVLANLINPGQGFDLSSVAGETEAAEEVSISSITSNFIPINPFEPFATGNLLQVIFVAIIFSVALLKFQKEAKPLINIVEVLSKASFSILNGIMLFAPLGILSLIASTTASYGYEVFSSLAFYIVTCYIITIIIMIVVVLIPLRILVKKPILTIIKSMTKIWIMTLTTTSSSATLPTTFDVAINDLGINGNISRFVLPIATTFNMIGGAVSFACLAVFVQNVYDVNYTPIYLIQIIVLATILNISAPGIPGGGIVLSITFLTLLGLPLDLIGPISGVYRLLDMAFTTLNVSGDVVAASVVEKLEGKEITVSNEVLNE